MESTLSTDYRNILVTGGAGFIGGCLVRKLLNISQANIFNIDKIGYASDTTAINKEIHLIGKHCFDRYHLLRIDLFDKNAVDKAIKEIKPDIVFHLAAESHVDRSIDNPEVFMKSNIIGTFNLLEALRSHFESLSPRDKSIFRLHHVSTDEVFGSIEGKSKFNENSPYSPQSPYSASKAASDHLVRAWHHTYGLPIIISNCSNNYGPWQLPEKLIPLVINKAINDEIIPVYGDGGNVRDWLHVEDHVEGILCAAIKGSIGLNYCIGGCNEYTNLEVVTKICKYLDFKRPKSSSYQKQIKFVKDRPGHDFRYAIDNSFLLNTLDWKPKYSFQDGLVHTINWYLKNLDWSERIRKRDKSISERVGLNKNESN